LPVAPGPGAAHSPAIHRECATGVSSTGCDDGSTARTHR
jgi:hypothetical protein